MNNYAEYINYTKLKKHIGHNIVCVAYNKNGYVDERKNPQNVSLVCETCFEVLESFDKK